MTEQEAASQLTGHKTTLFTRACRLKVLLDGGLNSRGVRSDHLADLLATLEEDESGHGADAELLRDVGGLVDVDLDELGAGVLVAVLLDLGRDGLARTAPGGEGVEDDQLTAGDGGVELALSVPQKTRSVSSSVSISEADRNQLTP